MGKFNLFTTGENINYERKLAEAEKLKVQKCLDARRQFADVTTSKVNQLDQEHKQQARIFENTVARLVHKNQTCFFTTTLSMVFRSWKAYMDRRRKSCQVFSTVMAKCAMSKAFRIVSDFSRAKDLEGRKLKTVAKAVRTYSKFRLKAAMSKWREHEYFNVCALQISTAEEMNQVVDDFAVKREKIKQHHTAVMSAKVEHRTCREWFAAWQEYASEERDTRLRTKNLREALKSRQISLAITKWNLRTQKTI